MTYHCGIGPRITAQLGFTDDPGPTVICNGCGRFKFGTLKSGRPAAWLRNGKAPPGWKMIRVEEPFSREDYCARCKDKTNAR